MTQKFCHFCKEVRDVVVDPPNGSQRQYRPAHDDIHYFRRNLRCEFCNREWTSVELPSNFVNELIALRDSLGDVKEKTEIYLKKAQGTTKSLKNLGAVLEDLKGLKSYKTISNFKKIKSKKKAY